MTLVRRIGSAAAAAILAATILCAGASASMGTKARITLDRGEASPGGAISGQGSGFDHWATDGVRRPPLQPPLSNVVWTNADYVQIHWNALEGAVVWEGAPDPSGRIRFQFDVPVDAAPGDYTVVATQTGYDGRPTGGTPTRATLRVLPAAPPSAEPAPAAPPAVVVRPSTTRPAAVAPRARTRPTRNAAPSSGVVPAAAASEESAAAPVVEPRQSPPAAAATDRTAAPEARATPRTAGALAHATRTRGEAPAAEPAPASRPARGAATATPTSEAGGVPWPLLVVAGLLAALAGAARAYAMQSRVRRSSVPPADASPVPAPDEIERELRELLAQYEDHRVLEPAGRR